MHRQHSPQPPPARRTATVHSEMPFLSGPSWSACARAPVSASLRCVQHHLHGHLYSTPLQCMHAYIYSPVARAAPGYHTGLTYTGDDASTTAAREHAP